MNSYKTLIFLFACITIVICNEDIKSQIQCMKSADQALIGKSDNQLFDLSQENLEIGQQLVEKRAEIANNAGLTCYKQFYDNYVKGLVQIFKGDNEVQLLNTASTQQIRSDATKTIAGITQAMRCDEDWRASGHFNQTVKSADCSSIEKMTFLASDLFSFRPKLELLLSGISTGSFAAKLKNNVVSQLFGKISKLYRTLYNDADRCARSQPTLADKCRQLKMFSMELDRLYQLGGLKVASSLPFLN
ncbi:uncharacterized protein LOC128963200 [Oppia nitens]|uniref:uncharacterized protein LOC128963200 n=1 Tax=Oppia nitens TaxID=1686743 RepID=UPI0023DB82DD|nr:uncharacterized protein LOC128963200 [Oppia nitens]